jgi:uncharacterized protein YndB with AHSA1/START domain
MTERSVTHATFTLERTYDAAPAAVFNAFADPAAKARWFNGPPEWGPDEFELDFRVGGREVSRGGPQGGPVHTYEAVYQDIIPDERIVSTYVMYVDDDRLSVSVSTLVLSPQGDGTHIVLTDQGAYFDGIDTAASREHGTSELLDALGASLQGAKAGA